MRSSVDEHSFGDSAKLGLATHLMCRRMAIYSWFLVDMRPKRTALSGVLALAAIVLQAGLADAEELAPIESYGALPEIGMMALSPDGTRLAMRNVGEGIDSIVIMDLKTGKVLNGANAEKVNPRSLRFANNDKWLRVAGHTVKGFQVRGAFDYSYSYVFDLNANEIKPLMRKANIHPLQGGLGRVIGASDGGNTIYIPAFVDSQNGSKPSYGIFKATFGKRREPLVERGKRQTQDWFMNAAGEALIREDYDNNKNLHQVWRVDGEEDVLLYEEVTEIPRISLVGISEDSESVVVIKTPKSSDFSKYYLMDMDDGSLSDPILGRHDARIESVFTDINRVVLGVRYSGFFPRYFFFDESMNNRIKDVQRRLPGMAVELAAWSDDRNVLVFEVEGGWSSGVYLMFTGDDPEPIKVGAARSGISSEQIAAVYVEEYEARDGLKIPALITARKDVYEKGKAPLIMMPHGGPSSYDRFGFDWMAQYFASRGYIVMQPQFRGSSGFGKAFELAGRGEWGGKMQSDLDDGVGYLVDNGKVDPERVCIVGASYGGYAALAAGAFSPDLYKCVVSFAGVSDLYQMLKTERADYGGNHWVLSYWQKQVGSGLTGKEFLRSISPVNHAANFKAPVLLLHGKDDTVVKYDQSRRMQKALKKERKQVEYNLLKGEDHWLTQPETRMETLRAMAEFIEKHL